MSAFVSIYSSVSLLCSLCRNLLNFVFEVVFYVVYMFLCWLNYKYIFLIYSTAWYSSQTHESRILNFRFFCIDFPVCTHPITNNQSLSVIPNTKQDVSYYNTILILQMQNGYSINITTVASNLHSLCLNVAQLT